LLEKRAQIETAIAELDRQIRVRRLEITHDDLLDATICGPFWWPLRQDNPDMEREIAAIQAAQPLSKKQIIAYELWAQIETADRPIADRTHDHWCT
jgi:hypothetical protein